MPAPLILVTPCAGMRGIFVSNAYLQDGKFGEPPAMFSASAKRLNIDLDLATNADLMVPAGDANALRSRIGDPDFILFWDKDVRCASNLELCGFRVFNPSECIRICDDKWLTHLALRRSRVPTIDTVSCPLTYSDYPDAGFLEDASGRLGFPLVVKDNYGSFGMQVRLARDPVSLREMFSGPYAPRIIQRYIECGGSDVRVEVVGGSAIAAMERHAAPGEFRSNATLGGTIRGRPPTAEEAELAIAACEAVGADFAGIDIIRSDEGDVVCEVNSSAHLRNLLDCTGIDGSEAILLHIGEVIG